MHGFSGPLGTKWCFLEGGCKIGEGDRGGAILIPNELVVPFCGTYVCANFGENQSRNATVNVLADGQTDFIICLMLHAIVMEQIINIAFLGDINAATRIPRYQFNMLLLF